MDAEIIDLVVIAEACRPLANWWHQFSINGDASPSELERARKHLATLSPTTGRVGRAIGQIVAAESQATTNEVLAALAFLARVVGCISGPVHDPPQPADTTSGQRTRRGGERRQPALPGFE